MKVNYFNQENTIRILVDEETIDIENADQLREILLDQVYTGNTDLLLDLQKVTFIDSSGLGALVYGLREARRYKGSIRVSGLTEHVSSMFSITRLNKIFEVI